MNDTIFAACKDISSHPIFSRRITSGSFDLAVLGNIGAPEGPNPKIFGIYVRFIPLHQKILAMPPFRHSTSVLSLIHAYVGRGLHVLSLFHHRGHLIIRMSNINKDRLGWDHTTR
jgi:hypothetical protein